MKPTPELIYEYRAARKQAIEDCKRRTQKLRREIPRLGEIAELRRDIASNMGKEILERGEARGLSFPKVSLQLL